MTGDFLIINLAIGCKLEATSHLAGNVRNGSFDGGIETTKVRELSRGNSRSE